jgi:hypothetical protein
VTLISLSFVCFLATASEQEHRDAHSLLTQALSIEHCGEENEWLRDGLGREYCIKQLPKVAGTYVMDSARKRVRIRPFYNLEFIREDESFLYTKFYRKIGRTITATERDRNSAELAMKRAEYKSTIAVQSSIRLIPFDSGLPKSGQWRNGFAIADMNDDGELDIVHSPPRKGGGPPVVFLGNGKGEWKRWAEAKFPKAEYDYGDVALSDFNNDGRMDLALGIHLKGLLVLLGNGQGEFRLGSNGLPFSADGKQEIEFSSCAIAAVDWNVDGLPDLAALDEGPSPRRTAPNKASQERRVSPSVNHQGAQIFINRGGGHWEWKKTSSTAGTFGASLSLSDFDGDGRKDILTASSVLDNRRILQLGQSDGSTRLEKLAAVRPRSLVRAVEHADFNNDGWEDIVISYSSFETSAWISGLDILYRSPSGGYTREVIFSEESKLGIYALSTGDINGDEKTDIVAFDGAGRGLIFLSLNETSFVRENGSELAELGEGCRGYSVALEDLNHDGKMEIIANFAGESAYGLPVRSQREAACRSGGAISVWQTTPR